MAMTVTVADTVAVTVKENETDNVDDEARDADVQHPVGVFNLMHVRQSLDRFNEDRKAQRDEEH